MKVLLVSLTLTSLVAPLAGAQEAAPALGLVLAQRVAAQENERGLPSRAVWLGNRVVQNDRSLAAVTDTLPAKKKKRGTVRN